MGSVSDSFSGTASGINNAIARISNVFANAIFGALAVLLLSASLKDNITTLPLGVNEKQLIMDQAVNLGNAKVPDIIVVHQAMAVEKSFHTSFIYAYSRIELLAAFLGFFGALMSFIFIRVQPIRSEP